MWWVTFKRILVSMRLLKGYVLRGFPKTRIFEKLCLLEVERGSMLEVQNGYALEMKFRSRGA